MKSPLPLLLVGLLGLLIVAQFNKKPRPAQPQEECPGGVCPTAPIEAACTNPDCSCEDCTCDPCGCVAVSLQVLEAPEPKAPPRASSILVSEQEPEPPPPGSENDPAWQATVKRVDGRLTIIPAPAARKRNAQRNAEQPPKVLDADSAKTPPAIGRDGWRLRVLHPDGMAHGLRQKFREDDQLRDLGVRYGYQAIATSDRRFKAWRPFGFPADRTTIVLVDDRNKVVYRADERTAPQTVAGIHDAILDAAERRRERLDWQPMWEPDDNCRNCARGRW